MKETIRLGVILMLITVVSAGVLAISNNLTKDRIAELEMAGSLESLKEIFGDSADFKPLDEGKLDEIKASTSSVVEIFEAYNGDTLIGYAIKHITKGFGGDLLLMTGFNLDGTVAGLDVLEHSETPGLGDRADDPEFRNRFVGLSTASEITVEALSGATVTTNAVLSGVNQVREVFNNQLSN